MSHYDRKIRQRQARNGGCKKIEERSKRKKMWKVLAVEYETKRESRTHTVVVCHICWKVVEREFNRIEKCSKISKTKIRIRCVCCEKRMKMNEDEFRLAQKYACQKKKKRKKVCCFFIFWSTLSTHALHTYIPTF